VPVELEEGALIDGCTRWQALLKVVLPVARNGIFATAVFTFIFAWNDHILAPVLARTDVMTFTVQVTGYLGAHSTLWAKISAMSPLGTLRISLVVATMQR
jgi:multiple sugar transport system permease protein